MPVSAPVSVTQSTALANQTKPPVAGQAWQTALDDAQDTPSPASTQEQTASPPESCDKTAAAPASSLLVSTLQTVSTRHNETPLLSTLPDETLSASQDTPATKPADKKDDPKNQLPTGVNVLVAATLPATPQISAQATQPAPNAKSDAVAAGANIIHPATTQPHLSTVNEAISLPSPAEQGSTTKTGPAIATSADLVATLQPHQTITATASSNGTPAQTSKTTQAVPSQDSAAQTNQAQAGQIAQLPQASQAQAGQIAQPPQVSQVAQPPAPSVATTQTGQTTQSSQPATVQASQNTDRKPPQAGATVASKADKPGIDQILSTTAPIKVAAATSAPTMAGGASQPAAPAASGTVSARLTTTADKVITPAARAQPSASQGIAVSDMSIIKAGGVSSQPTDMDLKKTAGSIQAMGGIEGLSHTNSVTPAVQTAPTSSSVGLNSISLAPSALSATITALHQSGQNGVTLRLDPPDLGHLSVQIKMDTQGAVNVLFVPSTIDAAHTLQNSLPQLSAALAQSGLTLGQAEVGGQFSQSGGQSGQQGNYTPARQPSVSFTESTPATSSRLSGLSAYA